MECEWSGSAGRRKLQRRGKSEGEADWPELAEEEDEKGKYIPWHPLLLC